MDKNLNRLIRCRSIQAQARQTVLLCSALILNLALFLNNYLIAIDGHNTLWVALAGLSGATSLFLVVIVWRSYLRLQALKAQDLKFDPIPHFFDSPKSS